MKRCFTDAVYNNTQQRKSVELMLVENRFYTRLSSVVSSSDYLKLEEELNKTYSEIEKEMFSCGFIDGIRFLIGCMES